ncbi:MAG: hypothetical protein CL526_12600 [Aequorivita sp.]|nr:hypothetical protein [Aequorivita sp.]
MKQEFYPLSFSSIKAFSQSPAHFIAYKKRQQHETPAMRFGTAVHCATLEAERFEQAYQVLKVRRGTAAYKAILEKHPEATFLSQAEYDDVMNLRDAVRAHPVASKLLEDCTAYEQELTGNVFGLPFRGFADGVAPSYVVDLKTTQKGSPRDFSSDAYRQKYHIQGFIYTSLLSQAVGRTISEHWLITVEKNSPYVVTCYRLTPEYLQRGREELEKLVQGFREWDGENRGYDHTASFGHFNLDVPAWAL